MYYGTENFLVSENIPWKYYEFIYARANKEDAVQIFVLHVCGSNFKVFLKRNIFQWTSVMDEKIKYFLTLSSPLVWRSFIFP